MARGMHRRRRTLLGVAASNVAGALALLSLVLVVFG